MAVPTNAVVVFVLWRARCSGSEQTLLRQSMVTSEEERHLGNGSPGNRTNLTW